MPRSRRSFLASAAAAGVATAASSALAGCTSTTGFVSGPGADPVEVLAAGSLQHALDESLADAVDAPVAVEARGSAAAARLVADGQRDPDVVALADTTLFDRVLDDQWYASFATNALALATADTAAGRAVRDAASTDEDGSADHWFDPLLDGTATLGRTDPDLDPLGYRTLFALQLAATHYDHPGLRDVLLAPDQVYPETALLSQFELGTIDAAVVYESMAVDRGYDAVDLPPAIDLSDPAYADEYATATYELSDAGVVHGDVIEYGATLRSPNDPAARDAFDALVDGDVLTSHGFDVPDGFPRYTENTPDTIDGVEEERMTGVEEERMTGVEEARRTCVEGERMTGVEEARRTCVERDRTTARAPDAARSSLRRGAGTVRGGPR